LELLRRDGLHGGGRRQGVRAGGAEPGPGGEERGRQLLAPCSACYMVLNKTQHYCQDYPEMKTVDRALAAVQLKYSGRATVRHPLDVLINDVGLEAIKQKVVHPLRGLKVAPYYGCQIVRPYATFDDQTTR
jgi:heterodisulfide reductase subunit B2